MNQLFSRNFEQVFITPFSVNKWSYHLTRGQKIVRRRTFLCFPRIAHYLTTPRPMPPSLCKTISHETLLRRISIRARANLVSPQQATENHITHSTKLKSSLSILMTLDSSFFWFIWNSVHISSIVLKSPNLVSVATLSFNLSRLGSPQN